MCLRLFSTSSRALHYERRVCHAFTICATGSAAFALIFFGPTSSLSTKPLVALFIACSSSLMALNAETLTGAPETGCGRLLRKQHIQLTNTAKQTAFDAHPFSFLLHRALHRRGNEVLIVGSPSKAHSCYAFDQHVSFGGSRNSPGGSEYHPTCSK